MKLAPDSAEAIANLNGQDIKTVMLTGDAEASANYIAKETGVSVYVLSCCLKINCLLYRIFALNMVQLCS